MHYGAATQPIDTDDGATSAKGKSSDIMVVHKATRQPSDSEYRDEPMLMHPDLERSGHVVLEH